MKKILILIGIAFIVYYYGLPGREIKHHPGALVTSDPIQENLSQATPINFKNYTITPMADFSITARVLSRENYHLDKEAELAPVDLALGWGPMSDSKVLEKIEITQSNRWYHWNAREFPIPRRDIETHSANMHMIPADTGVALALDNAVKGSIIELHGKLVSITQKGGWHWKSSMTREDTGNGACEVIWVENIYIKP